MDVTSEQLFAEWAPPESPWSVWAKPVLFADLRNLGDLVEPAPVPQAANFPLPPGCAVVIDIEGSNSVLFGLALAKIGYRPVPLYNSGVAPGMLVNMRIIAEYLVYGATVLRASPLPADAPPAFLLNSDRLSNSDLSKEPGRYDNRWCVAPQDMPSAEFLGDAGIKQVVLVADWVHDDLSHVLCRYQDAGLRISRTADFGIAPVDITVSRPPFYKSLVERLEVYAGLRRNAAGGFGAIVPDPNASGGFAG